MQERGGGEHRKEKSMIYENEILPRSPRDDKSATRWSLRMDEPQW